MLKFRRRLQPVASTNFSVSIFFEIIYGSIFTDVVINAGSLASAPSEFFQKLPILFFRSGNCARKRNLNMCKYDFEIGF